MAALVTPCCGAPVLGRPFQCVHEYEEWRATVPPGVVVTMQGDRVLRPPLGDRCPASRPGEPWVPGPPVGQMALGI